MLYRLIFLGICSIRDACKDSFFSSPSKTRHISLLNQFPPSLLSVVATDGILEKAGQRARELQLASYYARKVRFMCVKYLALYHYGPPYASQTARFFFFVERKLAQDLRYFPSNFNLVASMYANIWELFATTGNQAPSFQDDPWILSVP